MSEPPAAESRRDMQVAGGLTPESVFGDDDRTRITDTSAFPWTAIGQITVSAGATSAIATGVMIGPQHMLTAGHAVLSDGFGGDGRADSLTVDFGEGGSPGLDFSAEMVTARALPDWADSRAAGADLALVTLDRSAGAVTGFFDTFAIGLTGFFTGANVNIAGYPGDIANGQALALSTGQVAESTDERLFYNATLDTAGGMSGAPIWQYFAATDERKLIGIHTTGVSDTSAPGAANGGTRLTAERLALIDEWIGQDAFINPPEDRPDLAVPGEAMVPFEARLDTIDPEPGGAVSVTLNLGNLGTAASGPAEVTFYLSTNTEITEFDLPIGTVQTPGLAPLETREVVFSGSLPGALPSGTFHLGWRIDPTDSVSELDEANNAGALPQGVALVGDGLPNLRARDLVLGATDWTPGDAVTAAWTLANTGTADAPAATGSVLLASPDPQITRADRVLLDDPDSVALAAGWEITEGQPGSFTVPADLAPGTWHVAAYADPGGLVTESVESDNLSPPIVVTVTAPNAPPVALPDTAEAVAGTPVLIDVLANDSDPEGGALTLVSAGPAGHGAVTVADGRLRYTPDPGFAGTDTFGYGVADAEGAETTATVTITVTAPNAPPVALPDTAEAVAGTPVLIDVLDNDSDPEGGALTLVSAGPAGHGAVTVADGRLRYTPDPGFAGTDTFGYGVADAEGAETTATVTITVTAPNAPPVALPDTAEAVAGTPVLIDVLANDSDPEGGALTLVSVGPAGHGAVTVADGRLRYTPDPGFAGTDTFGYGVADAEGAETTATVTITVTAPNAPPVALPDTAEAVAGTPVLIDVLANDSDPEGGALTIADVTAAGHGAVELIAGSLRYTPFTGFAGTDALRYTVTDPAGLAAEAGLALIVAPAGLAGGAGPETLSGGAADDTGDAGDGDDVMDGRGGGDTLSAGPGDDRLFAGPGPDTAAGGPGADRLFGGRGNDSLSGGEGADTVFGQAGADTLDGGAGADRLDGGRGGDVLAGGGGADTLLAGAGDDLLTGGAGGDLLSAGSGSDTLSGGLGDDALEGGAGADIFRFAPGDGADRVQDFEIGTDILHLEGLSADAPVTIDAGPAGEAVLSYGLGQDSVALTGTEPADLAGESVYLLL